MASVRSPSTNRQSGRTCCNAGDIALRFSDLSASRKELVRLMQRTYNGFIYELPVRDGEPVLNPKPQVTFRFMFPLKGEGRLKVRAPDFALKQQVRDLFHVFDSLQNLCVLWLEVQDGMPFRMETQQTHGE